MKNIAWEKTRDGLPARSGKPPVVAKSGLLLKAIAIVKMTEVTLISAEFGSIALVFEPWVTVFADKGDSAEFFGIYRSATPSEENSENLPSLCLRTSAWAKDKDYEQFDLSENKKAYIESDKQLSSRITFLDPPSALSITPLVEKLMSVLNKGVTFEKCDRAKVDWHNVQLKVEDGIISQEISFTTFSAKNDDVESWIKEWFDCLTEKAQQRGIVSDFGCRVSYRLSISDRLAMVETVEA